MTLINLTEAKAKFSEVVERALLGEEFIITKMGKPAVTINSYTAKPAKKRLGLMEGQAKIPDNFKEWPEDEALLLGIKDDA